MRRTVLLGCFIILLVAQAAWAERYHVRVGGTRVSGASLPEDWTLPNCYPTLAAAAVRAAPDDSLLLDREEHILTQPMNLSTFLGNADLDGDNTGCEVEMVGAGELVCDPNLAATEIAGLQFRSDGIYRGYSALVVNNGGGGMAAVTVRDCNFEQFNGGHSSPRGGGCVHAVEGGGLLLTFRNCEFRSNTTPGRGGALRIDDGYEVLIEDCLFFANTAETGSLVTPVGGAIGVKSPVVQTSLTIRRTRFEQNISMSAGGAIGIDDGSLTLENCEILDSRSAWGGEVDWSAGAGIFMRRTDEAHTEPVSLAVADCVLARNLGDLSLQIGAGDGGAILVKGISGRPVAVTVERSDFFENYNAQGAGLYIGRFTNGEVSYCRFQDNSTFSNGGATFKGGAFAENLGETATYIYCEFVNNRAGYQLDGQPASVNVYGGAFCTRLHPRAEFYHCTFVDNQASGPIPRGDAIGLTQEGGAFDDDLKRCVLVNCVFFGENGNDSQIDADDEAFSRVENCAWSTGEFVCDGVTPIATTLVDAFPFVSPADLTPAAGSPLVDSGFAAGLSPDLNGTPVPRGLEPDIGAYEYLYPVAVENTPTFRGTLTAYPNPFNPRTTLACELPRDGWTRVTLHDLQGRLVRTLHDGDLAAGRHSWRWDGRDETGRALPSGTYLARVTTTANRAALKLVLVR